MDWKHTSTEDALRANDGRRVPYTFEPALSSPRQEAVLLLHGLGVDKNEYLGFYRELSKRLARDGFDVLRIDFPAHGDSQAEPSAFTLVNCIADAITACAYVLRRTGSSKLNLFGTSFGAGPAIAAASFFRAQVQRLTLLAPAVSYRDLYVSPHHPLRAQYARFYRRAVLDGVTHPVSERAALTWRNAIEFAMADFDRDLSALADVTAIIHGDADSMIPVTLSSSIVERHPAIDLTIVRGMDHGFMDRDDEHGTSQASQRNLQLILTKAAR